jgi:hypothetical protein
MISSLRLVADRTNPTTKVATRTMTRFLLRRYGRVRRMRFGERPTTILTTPQPSTVRLQKTSGRVTIWLLTTHPTTKKGMSMRETCRLVGLVGYPKQKHMEPKGGCSRFERPSAIERHSKSTVPKQEEEDVTPLSLEEIMGVTRYHEAGHAVAAYDYGYPITRVTVTDAECIAIHRSMYPSPEVGGWAELWREACITLAGLLADQRAMWGEMRPAPWAEFLAEAEAELEVVEDGEEWLRGDYSNLLELLQQMSADWTGKEPEESYRMVVEDSRQLVMDHWTEIEAVALALEQKGTLEGPEVMRIIEQASLNEEQTQR